MKHFNKSSMKPLNIIATPILNSEETNLKGYSDEEAFSSYKKLFKSMKSLTKNNDIIINLFSTFIRTKYDPLYIFPFIINIYYFNEYLNSIGKRIKEYSLSDDQDETLCYLDAEIKNHLINYLDINLNDYKNKLNNLEYNSENIQEINYLINRIKEIKTTIENIEYYYDRKMILFYIF